MSNNLKRDRSDDDLLKIDIKRLKMNDEIKVDSRLRHQRRTPVNPLQNVFISKHALMLPNYYISLLEQFTSLDCVVNKIISKNQQITLITVNKILNQMNKQDLEMREFGQILFVFPESYDYMFESSRYEVDVLNIVPNLKFGFDSSPRKSAKSLSLSQLIMRRNTFKERLMNVVKEEHDTFLINIKKMSVKDIKTMKIIRWCSDFDLASVSVIPSITFDKNKKLYHVNPVSICKELFKRDSQKTDSIDKSIKEEIILIKGKESDSVLTKKESPTFSKTTYSKESLDIVHDNVEEKMQDTLKSARSSKKALLQTQLSLSDGISKLKVQSPRKEQRINLMKQTLPFHLKNLFDLFVNFDKAVHSLYTQGSVVYLSSILKIVSFVRSYNESHFGQLLTIYPEAYKLRWENVLDKLTSKVSKKLDIVITPLLRQDRTISSLSSPTKGFIKFDCLRLKERSEQFLNNCKDFVDNNYKKYLKEKLSFNEDQVAEYLRRGVKESSFNVDEHVEMVRAHSMPQKPVLVDSIKIHSIKELFNTIKQRNATEMKDVVKTDIVKVKSKLHSVPQFLLDRVKLNKEKRNLFTIKDVDVKRRLIIAQLPIFLRTILTEFNKQFEKKPIEKSDMIKSVCKESGISEDTFDDHIELLNEVAPNYIQVLNWNPPCLKLGSSNLSIIEIEKELSSILKVQ